MHDNRHTRFSAATAIEGYVLPRPGESAEKAFIRARQEAFTAYTNAAAMILSLRYDHYRDSLNKTQEEEA